MTTGLGSTSAGLTVTAVKDGGKKLMSSISEGVTDELLQLLPDFY